MRWFGVWLVACSSGEQPASEAPDTRLEGPADVDVVRLTMDLGDRDGFPPQVPVAAYLPDDVAFDGARPPVVWFSGTAGAAPEAWHESLVHLSPWGVVVLAPTWDSVANPRSHQGLADDLTAAVAWLRSTPVEGVDPDLERQGAAGLGRGAKVAALAAAAAGLDALWLADPDDTAAQEGPEWPSAIGLSGLPITALVGTGGDDANPPCVDGAVGYEAFLPAAAWSWRLGDAGGADLVDQCVQGRGGLVCACGSGARPSDALTAARGWQAAFFRATLASDAAMEPLLDEPWY